MLFSCGLVLFTLLYSILKSCEWKCECESCESKMPKSPTKGSQRRDSPFTKEQEIWIVKRSALMTPMQLRRSFINQFLDPKKSHHLAPRPFAFTRLIQRFECRTTASETISPPPGQLPPPPPTIAPPQNNRPPDNRPPDNLPPPSYYLFVISKPVSQRMPPPLPEETVLCGTNK